MKNSRVVTIGDADYTLTFSFDAVAKAEDAAEVSIFSMIAGEITLRQLEILLWAALQDAHGTDRAEVGALIDKVGVAPVMDWVSEGLGQLLKGKAAKAA